MAENGNNANGYIRRTRFTVAKWAMSLIFLVGVSGIVIGLVAGLDNIVGPSITATITGLGGVAGIYIGGDSYRPSMVYPNYPTGDTVVINQGGGNQEVNQSKYPLTSEGELPPPIYIEG